MKPPIGKKTSTTLRAVKPILKPAQVFLSRLHPDTTEEEIKNFAVKQFVSATAVTCKKLDTKYSSYSSFCIVLNGVSFKESINVENWPSGTLVKRFYSSVSNSPEQPGNITSDS